MAKARQILPARLLGFLPVRAEDGPPARCGAGPVRFVAFAVAPPVRGRAAFGAAARGRGLGRSRSLVAMASLNVSSCVVSLASARSIRAGAGVRVRCVERADVVLGTC
jgi:hypothetical protein